MNFEEVLEEYNKYLVKVPNGCLKIAEFLRGDKINEALVSIQAFTEGLMWLSQMTTILQQQNHIKSFDIAKISEFLVEVNEGLMMQDYVLVADMFEYEIAPFFEQILQH